MTSLHTSAGKKNVIIGGCGYRPGFEQHGGYGASLCEPRVQLTLLQKRNSPHPPPSKMIFSYTNSIPRNRENFGNVASPFCGGSDNY